MKKNNGGASAVIVAIIVIVLLCGTAVLGIATVRDMRIADGDKMLNAGDYEGAAAMYGAAYKICLKADERILKGLASSALGMNDYDTAKKYYTELAELRPGSIEAHYVLAQIYIAQKDYGSAEREIEDLRKIGAPETQRLASELEAASKKAVLKGAVGDLIKEYLPRLPEIPGLTDDKPIEVPGIDGGPAGDPSDQTSADGSETGGAITEAEPEPVL